MKQGKLNISRYPCFLVPFKIMSIHLLDFVNTLRSNYDIKYRLLSITSCMHIKIYLSWRPSEPQQRCSCWRCLCAGEIPPGPKIVEWLQRIVSNKSYQSFTGGRQIFLKYECIELFCFMQIWKKIVSLDSAEDLRHRIDL
jgi:hypothetical protein